jgi:hypothetical protein
MIENWETFAARKDEEAYSINIRGWPTIVGK